MPTLLITGANRGLGLEFCRQYATDNWHVIGCCRQPDQASELNELTGYLNIHVESLDVADFEQINALSKKLADVSIDVLLNNAGIYADHRESGFGRLDYKAWTQTLLVNTMAPIKMAEAFLPQIRRGNKKLIVNISSLMGSLADNSSGGSIFYRTSKAALNAAMRSLSIDLKNQSIGILTLHPGWVKTDMGGPNAWITARDSVSGMRNLIANYSPDQAGCFVSYDGTPLPW